MKLASLDITYSSLAASFSKPLVYHAETIDRMAQMSVNRPSVQNQTEESRQARKRMALFPAGAEVLFTSKSLWVVSLDFNSISIDIRF